METTVNSSPSVYCGQIKKKELTPGVSSAYPGQAACPSAGPPRWRKNKEGSLLLSGPELHVCNKTKRFQVQLQCHVTT